MTILVKLSASISLLAILVASLLYFLDSPFPEMAEWTARVTQDGDAYRTKFKTANHSAFVLGYTGESGKALTKEILRSGLFTRVVLIGRRQVTFDEDIYRKAEQQVVDFERLDNYGDVFSGIDTGFCCMGTTKGKEGKEGFIRVDHDYVVHAARLAKSGGCQHFHLVSSMGANAESMFLYPQIKGKVEESVKQQGFHRLSIFRPGLLLCDRQESRPFEAAARFLLKPVAAVFPTVGSTPVDTLAKAMLNCAVFPNVQPAELLDNKAIHGISGQLENTQP